MFGPGDNERVVRVKAERKIQQEEPPAWQVRGREGGDEQEHWLVPTWQPRLEALPWCLGSGEKWGFRDSYQS